MIDKNELKTLNERKPSYSEIESLPDWPETLKDQYNHPYRSPEHDTDRFREEFEDKEKDKKLETQSKWEVSAKIEIEDRYR